MIFSKKLKKNYRRKSKHYKKELNEKKKDRNSLISNSLSEENNLISENYFSFEDLGFGSNLNDYLFGFAGQNIYEFGSGYDVIDYSYLPSNITLVRGGTVNKGLLGTDTFLDFYDKIIATNNANDWIDGLSNGGFIANLEINLSKNLLSINNLPGIGSISSVIEKFENLSGTYNSDSLIGDSSENTILGNSGDDFLFGKKGNDIIDGGSGNDFIQGGLGADILTGGQGADTFIYEKNKDSKLTKRNLKKLDLIKDFNVDEDTIHFKKGVDQNEFLFLGDIAFLTPKNINKALKNNSSFDYDAVGFTIEESGKTYVAINGCDCGFQSKNDLLIEITGYTGDLNNINISNGNQLLLDDLII